MNVPQQVAFIASLFASLETAPSGSVPDYSSGGVGSLPGGGDSTPFQTPGSGSSTGTAGGFGLDDVFNLARGGLDLYERIRQRTGLEFDPSAFGGGGDTTNEGPGAIPSADGSADGPGGFLGSLERPPSGGSGLGVPSDTGPDTYGEGY